jgi:deoxycytidylate deaminase
MKTDNYLTQCLEQAAKSPLHYRHGCIIVRGGKVIGQGYNDYRPGYDGGALKNGRIAKATFDGQAIASLKEKLKKQKDKPKEKQQRSGSTKTFTPFEANGGGHHANTPLSMHSEMMAIHSALSTSSTLSSTTTSYEKPCFKLPGSTKRKARLRRELLAAYVKTVCATSQRSGLPQVQECGFEASASQPDTPPPGPQQQQQTPGQGGVGGCGGRGQTAAGRVARVERDGSGVSRGVEWRETLSSSEHEEEEWEEGETRVSVRVSVRQVWTTDTTTTTFSTPAICV